MEVTEKYLTPNPYSRYGGHMEQVRGLVYHWVADPGRDAEYIWHYFENLKEQITNAAGMVARKASAHFIIDLDGSILQLMPLEEIAFHAGPVAETRPAILTLHSWPNAVLWGIEMCHPGWDGQYTEASLRAARDLGAYLCERADLNPDENILRHHDVTGKYCPRWFVDHPADFMELKWSIKSQMILKACAGAEGGD